MVIQSSQRFHREMFQRYSMIDLRWLAFFRIYLSMLAISLMVTYWYEADEFLTNYSLYPNHYLLFSSSAPGVSLFFPFSELIEVRFILCILITNAVWVLMGAGSVWNKVLLFVSISNLETRNLWLEDQGHTILNLLTLWMIFLPTHERFSLNRYRGRSDADWRGFLRDEWMPEERECPALLGVLLCLVLICLFNVLTKEGITWQTGQAVHYFLWMSDRVTPFGRWLRVFAPSSVLEIVTRAALWIECFIPLLILIPFSRRLALRIAGLLILVLYLGIATIINLGIFSYAMCGFCPLLFGLGVGSVEPSHSRYYRSLSFGAAVVLTYVQLVQATTAYWNWMGHTSLWNAPDWTKTVVAYLRIHPYRPMFSPDVPLESRQVRRFGIRSGTLWDLDSGQPLGSELLPVLMRTFDEQKCNSILRIESDSRFDMLNEDFRSFYQKYLAEKYPRYEHYLVVLVEWQSPMPGMRERPSKPHIIKLWQLSSNTISN